MLVVIYICVCVLMDFPKSKLKNHSNSVLWLEGSVQELSVKMLGNCGGCRS